MNKISELRERYSLSRKQMSELTGVPVRTLQSWGLLNERILSVGLESSLLPSFE